MACQEFERNIEIVLNHLSLNCRSTDMSCYVVCICIVPHSQLVPNCFCLSSTCQHGRVREKRNSECLIKKNWSTVWLQTGKTYKKNSSIKKKKLFVRKGEDTIVWLMLNTKILKAYLKKWMTESYFCDDNDTKTKTQTHNENQPTTTCQEAPPPLSLALCA